MAGKATCSGEEGSGQESGGSSEEDRNWTSEEGHRENCIGKESQ